jgi:hypothetical protein
MALEIITKFQPDRTMYFRGFSGIQCPASMNSASSTGFTISGVFRDPADFWVLVIYDIDDFYNHPRIKPLPDGNLSGIVLEFDVAFSNAVSLDVPKFPTIDWPFLDFIREDGTTGRVDISYGNNQTRFSGTTDTLNTIKNPDPTTVSSGTLAAASVTLAVDVGGMLAGDQLNLWFQNFVYSYTGLGGDNPNFVALQLKDAINGYDYSGQIYGLSAVNSGANITITASQTNSGVVTPFYGADGNMIRLYWTATDSTRENIQVGGVVTNPVQLSGGSSAVTFHVKLDFSNIIDFQGNNLASLRQAWLTFAPVLADSAAFTDTDADIVFSNWGITADPNGISDLKVAGLLSTRVEESNAATVARGTWVPSDVGWYSQGFAIASKTVGDTLTVTYSNQFTHDLWVGTSVYSDRGVFGVTVNGAVQPDLDMMTVTQTYNTTLGAWVAAPISQAVSTRRKIASAIPPGTHIVVLTVKPGDTPPGGISPGGCYFDFLEAVVASDVPDAPGPWTDRAPAKDYDTQHGYQLAPGRLLWMTTKLGFAGNPIDEYIGVFWWNQRANYGAQFASAVIDFSSVSMTNGDGVFLQVGADSSVLPIGKSFLAGDDANSVAAHFQYFINESFSGIWAKAVGAVLTITARSPYFAYQNPYLFVYLNTTSNPISFTGSLNNGIDPSLATPPQLGWWYVDTSQSPALNHGAATWHADLFALAVSMGTSIVSAFSLEIVQPPDYIPPASTGLSPLPGTPDVWTSCFANGEQVITATGSGNLNSSQCVPSASAFLLYQQKAYLHVAQLQTAAGHPVQLQCGEFLWWFFARLNLVPISFIAILAAVRIDTSPVAHGLGSGDTVLIAGVEGLTAVNGEWPVTVIDAYHFEIPASGAGPGWVPGTGYVSGGGMAYYDAFTTAAFNTLYSRTLGPFWLPTDDPSLHGYQDADFLAGQLAAHVAAIIAYVVGTYSAAAFEILFPNDVAGLTTTPISAVGGILNRYVDLPAAWRSYTTAPFQFFKLENLAFLTTDRNMNLVKASLAEIVLLDWPAAKLRYLYPVDNSGIAQWDEYRAAIAAGFTVFSPFAFDQINLIGWAVEPPPEDGSVLVQ